jgi:hypothetical protein
MTEFEFTQSERHFLSHWTYESSITFGGHRPSGVGTIE